MDEFKPPAIQGMPDRSELDILMRMLYDTNLDYYERQEMREKIEACVDYDEYNRLMFLLEDRRLSIDEVPNPSQKDINSHIKRLT